MNGTGCRSRAVPWLAALCLPLLLCALAACSRDTSDAGPRAAAAVAAIALQSDEYRDVRSALPLELLYRLPDHLPAGQPYSLDIELRTTLARGVLDIVIGPLAGAELIGESRRSIDIATAEQPLRLTLVLMPLAQAPRSLELAVALQGNAGRQVRSWHIDLPAE